MVWVQLRTCQEDFGGDYWEGEFFGTCLGLVRALVVWACLFWGTLLTQPLLWWCDEGFACCGEFVT